MSAPRERRSATERREQLLEAALHLLATEGLGSVTTRRITEVAGVSLGAFHYVFPDKQALLRALIESIADGITPVLRAAVSDVSADVETIALEMVEGFWRFVEATPDLQIAQYELTLHALRDPELAELAAWQYDRYVLAIATVLDEVTELPAGPARDELARFIVAMMDGLILQYTVQRDVPAARRRLAMLESLVRSVDVRQLAQLGLPDRAS